MPSSPHPAAPLHHSLRGETGSWVLLLHGLFGSGDNLGALGRALAASHRVALVDLPGHGRSPAPSALSLTALAAAVADLQDHLGTGPCALVGHSLGGKVAMQLALGEPGRVARLVVADIAPVAYPRHHGAIFAGLRAVEQAAPASRAAAEAALATAVTEPAVRQFLLKNLEREGEGYRWRLDWRALEAGYDGLAAAPAGEPWPGPALFIRGGRSDYIGAAGRAAIETLFPAARIETLAEAGHWLHAEQPAAFNALVADFLG